MDRVPELAEQIARLAVRETPDRPALLAACGAIARDDRAAARLGQAISAAIVNELQHGTASAGPVAIDYPAGLWPDAANAPKAT